MRGDLPGKLGEEVRAELGRLGSAPKDGGDLTELVTAWPRRVGAAIAANAWPARFTRDGSLIVHVSSSAWGFELANLEPEILARLGELAPRHLKFVPGPLPEAEEIVPRVEQARAKTTPAARARAAAIAAGIGDPGLRELVARAAAASLSRADGKDGAAGSSGRLV